MGSTLSETRPRVCGGRERETCPEIESHCLIVPSAEMLRTVSALVQETPQTASPWAEHSVNLGSRVRRSRDATYVPRHRGRARMPNSTANQTLRIHQTQLSYHCRYADDWTRVQAQTVEKRGERKLRLQLSSDEFTTGSAEARAADASHQALLSQSQLTEAILRHLVLATGLPIDLEMNWGM